MFVKMKTDYMSFYAFSIIIQACNFVNFETKDTISQQNQIDDVKGALERTD